MSKFRKKPVVIEAIQFMGPDPRDVDQMLEFDDWLVAHGDGKVCVYSGSTLIIPTLEGNMMASPGDWIIRGVQGELYPCKPDIFAATYEAVP